MPLAGHSAGHTRSQAMAARASAMNRSTRSAFKPSREAILFDKRILTQARPHDAPLAPLTSTSGAGGLAL